MKTLFILIITFLISGNSFAQDLPHYMTEREKELNRNYIAPGPITDEITPPPTPVRTMAEWEEVQGIIVAWTSYTTIIRQIVDYAQDEGQVFIVCSDSNSVKTFLTSGGVPLTNLKFIITPFNSVWCRDYGPWAAYSGISDSLKMIDWIYNRPRPQDDQVPVGFASYMNFPIYQAISAPNDFTHTGGNFMVDGNGTGFSSKLVLNENPSKTESQINSLFNSYLGINRYIKMETLPYDEIHHIDMHIKLLDEETLLVGQYPSGVADGPQIEANLQYVLNNYQTCYGRPYKVVRIPMPPNASGQYPPSANYFTYTNSVFVNKTVIVPVYGLSQDTTALRIYRENLPGYRIVSINCASMISALGAIHCITKEIGVNEPVFFSHAKLLNTLNTTSPYEVKSYIKTKSGVASARVYWRTDTTQAYNTVNMTQSLDTFIAGIPAQPFGTKIYYYISATSNSGRTTTKPLTAPSGYIKFAIDNPTSILTNTVIPDKYSLSQNYPNPFNPSTQLEFEISNMGFVTLKVYDVLGNEVKNLVNENKPAGRYKVTFDGSNLSSGIYFYKLESGAFIETKRMILLK
ncbi:MAG TPA: agmatine deiminase family protein [Ignavibacteria bacterium]|nr:agmatine deiminase family protein [Ignavibacteria bacterium]